MLSRALTVIMVVASVVGCELVDLGPRECTLIGCESAVTFHLSADLEVDVEYRVEACVEEFCEIQTLRVPLPADGPFTGTSAGALSLTTDTDTVTLLLGERELPGLYRARITVTVDGELVAEADAEVAFERTQPNGPDCPPVCWIAQVRI